MTTHCAIDGCGHPLTPCTGACISMIEQIRDTLRKPTAASEPEHTAQSALETQVGGDHYKKLAIQPMEYSMANNLDACQHTAIKYITRFRDKGGIADLHKAKHVIDMLIEFEGKNS